MQMASQEKPHIIVVPFPSQGHLLPMVYLSRYLASRGFTVTMVNVESVHRTLTNKWKPEPDLDIRFEKLRSSMNFPFGLDASANLAATSWSFEMELLEKEFELLLARMRPSHCVVSDYFSFWGVSVSRRMGIPAVCYFPGSVAWSSIHHHLDLLKSNGDLDSYEEDKIISYVPGIEELKFEDVPSYLKTEQRRKWLEPGARCMQDCDWILVNSFEELEPATFRVMREVLGNKKFVPVAPLFELAPVPRSPGSLREEDVECMEWLDSKTPGSVLYISFGSLSTISEEFFGQLAKGLEGSQQTFLWVIRQDLIRDQRSHQDDQLEKFISKTKGQGLVVSWAPQLRVLAHPAVGGFLSHCGWNSLVESLCNGVPLLCSPCKGDQPLNAKMVIEDFQMGMKYDSAQAARVIEKFMAGQEEDVVAMRSRLVEFRSKARVAASEGGISYTSLNKFMDTMRMYC